MATEKNKHQSCNSDYMSLHDQFRIIGDHLSPKDIKALRVLFTSTLSEDVTSNITDGYTFLLALERDGRVDESNFRNILRTLEILHRHDLIQFLCLRKRKPVSEDPIEQYLGGSKNKKIKRHKTISSVDSDNEDTPNSNTCNVIAAVNEQPSTSASQGSGSGSACGSSHKSGKKRKMCTEKRPITNDTNEDEITKKASCDIRLRVRAEYCQHEAALRGNIASQKPDLMERQFEKFTQANTILKSRDLGSIICDIKFSELTYLDAFWRDYVNGSLLEALKGVFITESLKQAVGHEAIRLLVSVDEDDYQTGRRLLIQNLD